MSQPIQGASPKVRPILFSSPMIRALLEGRKTQTRRIAKSQSLFDRSEAIIRRFPYQSGCPFGKPGDLLWCRETWQLHSRETDLGKVVYRASENASHTEFHRLVPTDLVGKTQPKPFQAGWRPSIHMPRWASRLTLELTDVRVQRLQEISDDDAIAEGVVNTGRREGAPYDHYVVPGVKLTTEHEPEPVFAALWESINGEGSWNANPWVWALSFRVHQQNVDALLKERAAA